jgi:hypothetical protein
MEHSLRNNSAGLSGNRTYILFLINDLENDLENASWFGTLRVLEEDSARCQN